LHERMSLAKVFFMKLSSYLRQNAIRREHFALMVGVSKNTIDRLCAPNVAYSPSESTAQKISQMTGGAVNMSPVSTIAPGRPSPVARVNSGFAAIDRDFGMYRPGTLTALAGRPGMGKTSKACADAVNVALDGFSVLYFSTESTKTEVRSLMISGRAKADRGDVLRFAETGDAAAIDGAALGFVVKALGELDRAPLHIFDGAMSVDDVRDEVQIVAQSDAPPVGLVVIDRAELLSGPRRESREVEFDETIRRLLGVAGEFSVPLLVTTTIPRGYSEGLLAPIDERPDKRPRLEDLRERDAIAQHSSRIFLLHREEVYQDDSPRRGVLEMICAKSRATPRGVVELAYCSKSGAVSNLDA